jgi:hypothetical protein
MLQFLKRVFRAKRGRVASAVPTRPHLEVLEGREVPNAALPVAFSWGVADTPGSNTPVVLRNGPAAQEAVAFKVTSAGNPAASYSPDGDKVARATLAHPTSADGFSPAAGAGVMTPALRDLAVIPVEQHTARTN